MSATNPFIHSFSTKKRAKAGVLTACIGSLLVVAQIVLLLLGRDGVCVNEGCRIIDSLIAVSPLVINAAGLFFFQAVMWGLWLSGEGKRGAPLVETALTAAMASEGLLFAFQRLGAGILCSYCLVILLLVLLLNAFAGRRQIIRGGVVFAVVFLTFSVLRFPSADIFSLEKGTMGRVEGGASKERRHLFFSSSCPHCEDIFQKLEEENICTLYFNPVDSLATPDISGVQAKGAYSFEVNRRFLKGLGIDTIPVLLVRDDNGMQVIQGGEGVADYLEAHCRSGTGEFPQKSAGYSAADDFLPSLGEEQSCQVAKDCDDASPKENALRE